MCTLFKGRLLRHLPVGSVEGEFPGEQSFIMSWHFQPDLAAQAPAGSARQSMKVLGSAVRIRLAIMARAWLTGSSSAKAQPVKRRAKTKSFMIVVWASREWKTGRTVKANEESTVDRERVQNLALYSALGRRSDSNLCSLPDSIYSMSFCSATNA